MKTGDWIWYRNGGIGKRIHACVVEIPAIVKAIKVERPGMRAKWIPTDWILTDNLSR